MLPRNLTPSAALAALAALVLIAPAVALADTVERTFDVAPGGTLKIDTDQGSIDIRSAPGNQVRIRVERKARSGSDADFELRFEQRGDDVIVTGERPGSGWFGSRRFRVRFEIEVPQRYNLDLDTSGGSISIADLEGDVDCHTSGGSISIDDIDGKVDCRTSGGGIDIGRIEGSVLAKTSGGSIRIDRSGGSVVAKTSGGNITVHEVLGSIEATTSGGNIKATISQQPQADCRLSTSGGRVELALASSIAVDLDAKTSGGRVNVDLPVTVQGHLGRSSLQGKINGGGPQLYLRTSGGSIYIRKIG
ncbi:MAG: DUF4097 family beta strand repeat-containing protein [Acidobacteria bacterium]|nr:DUF4097 family beta strand repeat-containing protein [Acidobacteriota bacterium]